MNSGDFKMKAVKNIILISAALLAPRIFASDVAEDLSVNTSVAQDDGTYRTQKYINLTLGIEQDLKLPPLPSNVTFKGDFRRIVSAAHSKELNVLRLVPKAEGFSTLTIHDNSNGKIIAEYRIDVKKSKLDKVVREIRALLGDIEGISIKVVNNRVIVDGQILLPKDMSRIYSVVSQFGDQASSIVTLSPLSMKKITEYISRDINNPEVNIRSINDKIILEGQVGSEDEKARCEIIAKTYLPDVMLLDAAEDKVLKKRKLANDGIINLLTIKEGAPAPPSKMVQLVVHYVELSKNYQKGFSFKFEPTIDDQKSGASFQVGDNAQGNGVVSSITGVISNLLPKLHSMKSHGHARVLESTTIIVEDGKKGEISQMTKQPYAVVSKEGTGTAFADVGIKSTITPKILQENSGSINLSMEFSVSSLLGANDQGAPVTSQNLVNTSITIRDRQSAAVGGLITNSSSNDYNPGAPAKNALISLYASKAYQRKQSQFVVFVTPIIKTSASQGSEQVKKKFRLRD